MAVGVDGGTDERWEKPYGGKAPAASLQTHFTRTDKTERYGYASDENDAPRRAREPDPPDRSPRTVSIRSGGGRAFAAARPEEAGTSGSLAGRGGNDEGAKHDAL